MKQIPVSIPCAYGVDFSSSPSRQKPVVVAQGKINLQSGVCVCEVQALHYFTTLASLETFLSDSRAWVGAFDMPFGLSRALINTLQWPGFDVPPERAWDTFVRFYSQLSRSEIREVFKAWCDAHPPGQKFAHRASDRPARSSPSMKWVNPPVAYMLHAGAAMLQRLDAHIPQMRDGSASRIALEAYPGFLARALSASRSYKHDDPRQQTQTRQTVRHDMVDALLTGTVGVKTGLPPELESAMREDGKGDELDSVLCLVQLARAWSLQNQSFDLPSDVDCLEGWILTVPWRGEIRQPDVLQMQDALRIRTAVLASVSLATRQRLHALGAKGGWA
jgi:hypothetical protein